MSLFGIELTHLRNIVTTQLLPCSGLNIIWGNNGSGKTSLLEAIHILGLGRSFRARNLAHVIHHQAQKFIVFGQATYEQQGHTLKIPMGIERERNSTLNAKINGEKMRTAAQLATTLPLLLLNHDSYRILQSAPDARRRMLDWGLFHVEQSFYSVWLQMQRLLKQRNAALRQESMWEQLPGFSSEFVKVSEALHSLRLRFCEQWFLRVQDMLPQWLKGVKVDFQYKPGWNTDLSLHEVMQHNLERDKLRGYTQAGPHRADIAIWIERTPAHQVLSLGQQKGLMTLLLLSQAHWVQEKTEKQCIFLVDDLPSELDDMMKKWLLQLLVDLQAQIFMTSVQALNLTSLKIDTKMFHVEHGRIV